MENYPKRGDNRDRKKRRYVPQCIMCCDRKTADHVISREYQDAPILR